MLIYRINENSRTGIDILQMPDNYEPKDGDYTSLPTGLTPYKVVNGQLVASNEAEHEVAESEWVKAHPNDVQPITNIKPEPTALQKANAQLMAQVMSMQAKQNQINAALMKQMMTLQTKIK